MGALEHKQGAVFGGKVYVMLGSGLGDWPVGATVGLKAAADYGIVGQAFEDHLGVTLASVGDMNADGTDDLVVTAYLNNHNAPVIGNSGKVYLFTGEQSTTAAPGTVFDASWASASLLGANFFDNAGRRIAGEGDVDGDGKDDLLITNMYNEDVNAYGGAAFILYGPMSGDTPTTDHDVAIYGDASAYLGRHASALADLDGNGSLDVVVGSYATSSYAGETYVFFDGQF